MSRARGVSRIRSITPIPLEALTAEAEARFWKKVNKRSGSECWVWTACATADGYGKFSLTGKMYLAHRVSMAIAGRNSDELFVMHACDNPPCCNPAHLLVGTHAENMEDARVKRRFASGDAHGRRTRPEKTARGERQWCAKLTVADIIAIRADGRRHQSIADELGVSRRLVGMIKARKIWRHVL